MKKYCIHKISLSLHFILQSSVNMVLTTKLISSFKSTASASIFQF